MCVCVCVCVCVWLASGNSHSCGALLHTNTRSSLAHCAAASLLPQPVTSTAARPSCSAALTAFSGTFTLQSCEPLLIDWSKITNELSTSIMMIITMMITNGQ